MFEPTAELDLDGYFPNTEEAVVIIFLSSTGSWRGNGEYPKPKETIKQIVTKAWSNVMFDPEEKVVRENFADRCTITNWDSEKRQLTVTVKE